MPTDKKISELPVASSVNATDLSVLVNGGTDYQYTFTRLLQFIAANLTVGANISFGTILPQNTSGKNGDVFVNTAAGSFAQKVSGTWAVIYTLPPANAADGALLFGAGFPGSGTGKNLDSYVNTLTGIFYKKTAGAWSQVFSMAAGPQGPRGAAGANGTNGINGNSILFGTINPSNSTTGNNGDFYINTSSYDLFGPKTAGVWGYGTSLIGAGISSGGTAGQILTKADGIDFNTTWQDNSFANLSGAPADNTNMAATLALKQNILGFTPEDAAKRNQANGYAGLDVSGKVAAAQLPSYVDDVVEFASYASLPSTGEAGKIYVVLDENKEYRWSGTTYIQLVASPGSTDAMPEGSANLYFTAARVLATLLNGLSTGTSGAVIATDDILTAIGKLQAQLNAGATNYINNTTTLQSASFNIDGDGKIGNTLVVYKGLTAAISNGIADTALNVYPLQVYRTNATSATSFGNGIILSDSNTNQAIILATRRDASDNWESGLAFKTRIRGGGFTLDPEVNMAERLTIRYDGLVGINFTQPGSMLQVNGNTAIGYAVSTAAPVNGLAVAGDARFDGKIGIGISPAAAIHLRAGTAAAGTAPLKLNAGTNLAAPEAGAIEFDGADLFYTNAGAARKTIASTAFVSGLVNKISYNLFQSVL
ncbi:MAG: hypothetical protein ACXVJD_18035 [Mucilaginibacter sp.]